MRCERFQEHQSQTHFSPLIAIAAVLGLIAFPALAMAQASDRDTIAGVAPPVGAIIPVTPTGSPLGYDITPDGSPAAISPYGDTPTGSMLKTSAINTGGNSNRVNAEAARQQGINNAQQLFNPNTSNTLRPGG